MNRSVFTLAFAACLLLGACGGGAAASPVGSPSPAASTAPAATSPTATASAGPAASGVGNGAALCTFLTSEIPAMQKAGSTGGALSVVAIDYANWIAADSSRVLPDAAAMDTLTLASCPDIRTNVLKLIGAGSFASGF